MIEPKSVQKFDELVENSSIEDFFLSGTIVLGRTGEMLEFSVVESQMLLRGLIFQYNGNMRILMRILTHFYETEIYISKMFKILQIHL